MIQSQINPDPSQAAGDCFDLPRPVLRLRSHRTALQPTPTSPTSNPLKQQEIASIFHGLFGGYAVYDHIVCSRMLPLERMVHWTKQLTLVGMGCRRLAVGDGGCWKFVPRCSRRDGVVYVCVCGGGSRGLASLEWRVLPLARPHHRHRTGGTSFRSIHACCRPPVPASPMCFLRLSLLTRPTHTPVNPSLLPQSRLEPNLVLFASSFR